MFPQIICTLVIYSWLLPKMLSDPISQSEKESVRDSTSLTLVYQIFSFWWGKKTSFLSSVFIQGTRNTILLVISWNRHFRLKSLFTLKIHGPLWKMGFQHVFFILLPENENRKGIYSPTPFLISSDLFFNCRNRCLWGDVDAPSPFNTRFKHFSG